MRALSSFAASALSLLVAVHLPAAASAPDVPAAAEHSPLSEFYLRPTRIVWQSPAGITHADRLLGAGPGQIVLGDQDPPCVLAPTAKGAPVGVLLDFGREVQGYVEIFGQQVAANAVTPVRVRFGESAAEAMSDIGEPKDATNDHAVRDLAVNVPSLGKTRLGPTGFRFVRIDAVDPAWPLQLAEVRAVLVMRDIPQIGSFRSSDERLNRIWQTGAYTVHLNMQDYLWDGIKRDRLVWIGDMHPEVSTIDAVFGFNEVVPRSLDLVRDHTPAGKWMNGISSYSMWWVLIQEQWWMHHGNRAYLEQQAPTLHALLARLAALVGPDGHEQIPGFRFLDWPSSPNKLGVTAGLQSLLVMALDAGERLARELGDDATATRCHDATARARPVLLDPNASKSAAALQVLSGQRDARQGARDLLEPGGARGVSTFYGFYVLKALGEAGETDAALDMIRTYWGAMLDRGATTFWEDFNLDWLADSSRIDELPAAGQKDLHGDFGGYCYVGYRHSFCHGWASGPTAFLSEYVLGVRPVAPGFARVRIQPQLGKLDWVEGTYPTPRGPIKVRHERRPDGSIHSDIGAPPGVEIVQ